MKCIVIFLALMSARAGAVAFPPVESGTSVVHFVFVDYGKFVRDSANANAILKFTRAKDLNVVELYVADGKGPPRDGEDNGTDLDGNPAMSRLVPKRLLAKVTLAPTAPDSSVYAIVEVESTERDLVFVKGGSVNFAGSTPGFDLGSTSVIEIREDPAASRHWPMIYVEALIPPGCEANAT